MTVRQQINLFRVAYAAMIAAAAVNLLVLILNRHQSGSSYTAFFLPLIFLAAYTGQYRRLRALEAEHGPDYVAPGSQMKGRTGLVVVGLLVAAAAGGLAVVLMLRR